MDPTSLLPIAIAHAQQAAPPNYGNYIIMDNTMLWAICLVWFIVGMLPPVFIVIFLAPDSFKIATAKMFRRPLLMIHFADRHTIIRVAKKLDAEAIFFVLGGKIYRIDSRIYREGKADNYKGIDLIHYYINSLFPIGAAEAKSTKDSIEYVKNAKRDEDLIIDDIDSAGNIATEQATDENGEPLWEDAEHTIPTTRNKKTVVYKRGDAKFPFLSTLPDKAMANVLFMGDDELERDVKAFTKIDTHGLSKDEAKKARESFAMGLIADVQEAKLDLSGMHIASGGFNYQTASQLVNSELTSRLVDDLTKAMMMMKLDTLGQIKQLMPWFIGLGIILVCAGLGYKLAGF